MSEVLPGSTDSVFECVLGWVEVVGGGGGRGMFRYCLAALTVGGGGRGLGGGGAPHWGQNNPMRAGQNEWTQHFDEQSGQVFFANAATKETRWQNPEPTGLGERQLSTQHVVGGYAV